MRRFILLAMASIVLGGCTQTTSNVKTDALEVRINELAAGQKKLELRMDELARELLVLKDRVNVVEAFTARPAPMVEERQVAPVPKVEDISPASAPVKTVQIAEEPDMPPVEVVELKPEVKVESQKEASVSVDAASRLYAKAFGEFKAGSFARAILDFEEFLYSYPDHDYADDARYWIGESYYSQGEYQQAITEWGRLVERYSQKARAADGWYMIGESYDKLGDATKAQRAFARVVEEYPQSDAARRAHQKLQPR